MPRREQRTTGTRSARNVFACACTQSSAAAVLCFSVILRTPEAAALSIVIAQSITPEYDATLIPGHVSP